VFAFIIAKTINNEKGGATSHHAPHPLWWDDRSLLEKAQVWANFLLQWTFLFLNVIAISANT